MTVIVEGQKMTSGAGPSAVDMIEARYQARFGDHVLSPSNARRVQIARRADGRWYEKWARSWARRGLRATDDMVDIQFRGGKFRLLPKENSCDLSLAVTGTHPESDEIDIFLQQIRGAEVFVDIGANIGIYSVLAAPLMAKGGKILAFEPHPRTFVKLCANVALNGIDSVATVNKAVGAHEDTALLRIVSSRNAGMNTLLSDFREKAEAVEVPVTPLLAELVARGITRIDVLKIDIEGYEDQALGPFFDTAPRDLWPRYILVEIAHAAHWARDLLGQLDGLGYIKVFENSGNAHFTLDDTQNT